MLAINSTGSFMLTDRTELKDIITKPLLYLSTFFQSKLRLMTTGGPSSAASDGGIVLDRQAEVKAQHRPSAKSENAKKRKESIAHQLTNNHKQILHNLHKTLSHSTAHTEPDSPYWSRISASLHNVTLILLTVYVAVVIIWHAYCIISCFVTRVFFSEQEIYRVTTADKKMILY